jgi:protein gp37
MYVFCASMADVFERHPDAETNARMDEARERLWSVIEATPFLTWQLLTKRPENVMEMAPWEFVFPPNVWVGTSIENSAYTWRADVLKEVPASIRFLSCEPLLGSLFEERTRRSPLNLYGIDWVIGGGESGPAHRPTDPVWARELRDKASEWGVPFFWKQWGGLYPKSNGKAIDGVEHCEIPDPYLPALL